ncbi:plasmid recombination enzyme, partial [Dysgonomonas alginatilytica]
TRTHLNKELIHFPEGVNSRTEAIQHRIENADIKRKISKDQVRAIRIMLSGTHEDMKDIEESGNLDNWCTDNIDWLKQTYGEKNLVSAVLHMDEKTPHIHATVVPIVTGERRKVKDIKTQEINPDKKKYKKKSKDASRLCADDVMARNKLKEYQNSYAEWMKPYGLDRGIDGSKAKHTETYEYYRELLIKNEGMYQSLEELKQQEKEAYIRYEQANILKQQKETELKNTDEALKQRKGQLKTEKFVNKAADVGSTIMDGIGLVMGTSKVKKQQHEIDNLKADKETLAKEIKELRQGIKNIQKEHETILDKLKQELKKIYDLFPNIKELLRIENLCNHLRFSESLIKKILEMKPVGFKGRIYSAEYERSFETDHSVAEVKPHPTEEGKLEFTIDSMSHVNWFRQKYQEFQRAIGIDIKQKPSFGKKKGIGG